MGMITLSNPSWQEATLLSNIFIDDYMPEANGEFVKVYIYLLRTLSNSPVSFSLEEMADRLLCTKQGFKQHHYSDAEEKIFFRRKSRL